MEKILRKENLQIAVKKVKQNKGAPGVDKMTVDEVETWFEQYQFKPSYAKRLVQW